MKAFPSAVVTYERLYKVQAFRKFTKVSRKPLFSRVICVFGGGSVGYRAFRNLSRLQIN